MYSTFIFQPLFRRRLSARSDSHDQSQYSWLHYPADASVLPPYAPPLYRSVDNMQDCGATPYIVPPPVFDPTDLPPPYSSRNASLSSSGLSLDVHSSIPPVGRRRDSDGSAGGSVAIVVSEGSTLINHQYENRFQQRVYSENRPRPGNMSQVTNVVLTRVGVLERCGTGIMTGSNQSISDSHGSLAGEKAEECRESTESIHDKDLNYKRKQTSRCLTTVEHSSELIMFEEDNNKKNANKENRKKSKSSHKKSCKVTEDEISTTSDSGIGDELSVLTSPQEMGDEDSCKIGRESPDSIDEKDPGIDSSDHDEKPQECNFDHLSFSFRDSISLEDQENHDSGTNLSTDTLVNFMDTDHHSEAFQLNRSKPYGIENFVEEIPSSQIDLLRGQMADLEISGTSNVKESYDKTESVNIVENNDTNIIDNGMVQFTENSFQERHITDEVIRLMDDFESSAEIGACGIGPSQPELPYLTNIEQSDDMSHVVEDDVYSTRKKEQLNEGKSTSSYAEKQLVLQPFQANGTSAGVEKECMGKRVKPLTRSDTCIAAIPKQSREVRAGSDPGVGSIGGLVYPGYSFTFQLVPPNIELPLQIREENMCAVSTTSPQENKRRKRQSERDVPRYKRRALTSRTQSSRQKAKCQNPVSRKDEAVKPRERYQTTQTTRHRAEGTLTHLQSYKAKSSAQRGRDGWLKDSIVWPSLRKARPTPQRYATVSSLSNEASGVSSSSECANCTGKETIV